MPMKKPKNGTEQLDLSQVFLRDGQHKGLKFLGRIVLDLFANDTADIEFRDRLGQLLSDRGDDRVRETFARCDEFFFRDIVGESSDRSARGDFRSASPASS